MGILSDTYTRLQLAHTPLHWPTTKFKMFLRAFYTSIQCLPCSSVVDKMSIVRIEKDWSFIHVDYHGCSLIALTPTRNSSSFFSIFEDNYCWIDVVSGVLHCIKFHNPLSDALNWLTRLDKNQGLTLDGFALIRY